MGACRQDAIFLEAHQAGSLALAVEVLAGLQEVSDSDTPRTKDAKKIANLKLFSSSFAKEKEERKAKKTNYDIQNSKTEKFTRDIKRDNKVPLFDSTIDALVPFLEAADQALGVNKDLRAAATFNGRNTSDVRHILSISDRVRALQLSLLLQKHFSAVEIPASGIAVPA